MIVDMHRREMANKYTITGMSTLATGMTMTVMVEGICSTPLAAAIMVGLYATRRMVVAGTGIHSRNYCTRVTGLMIESKSAPTS